VCEQTGIEGMLNVMRMMMEFVVHKAI